MLIGMAEVSSREILMKSVYPQLLDGKALAQRIQDQLKAEVERLKSTMDAHLD